MKLGNYETEAEIGRGGMGVVYKGRAPSGQDVAIKLLLHTDSGDDLARFDRERRLQAQLGEAEGFVPLIDTGDSPQGPFLVMPFVAGGTLRNKLRMGPMPIDQAVEVATALARGLGHAHVAGIIHRDLKPDNVLFTADGRPLYADMGLAKNFSKDPTKTQSVQLSQAGDVRGTYGYMAPEQMKDTTSATPASDVFSLGAMIYECVAGRAAFGGTSLMEVLKKVRSGDLVPLQQVRPDAPAWLCAAVHRALAPDPAFRFANGGELAFALMEGKKNAEAAFTLDPRLVKRAIAVGCALAAMLAALIAVAIERRLSRGSAGAPEVRTPAAPAPK